MGVTFEGEPGDDPQDFLDDIEIEVKLRCGKDASNDEMLQLKKSMFRNGLRGQPKKWYRSLLPDNRSDWEQLKWAFKRRFPWRESTNRDRVWVEIWDLTRNANEKLSEYVIRATDLANQADDYQIKELRDRFYGSFYGDFNGTMYGIQDQSLQTMISSCLEVVGKIDDAGKLTSDCTFHDVRTALVECVVEFEQSWEFREEVERGIRYRDSMTPDEALGEIGLAMRAYREMLASSTNPSEARTR